MGERHLPFWPSHVPRTVAVPEHGVFESLAATAARLGHCEAICYYGTRISYGDLLEATERLAGTLRAELGVAPGDRVLLYLQNSPQFVIGYYGILRAGAIVVPLNPMLREAELRLIAGDTGARVVICAQDLIGPVEGLLASGDIDHAVVATYSDYCPADPPVAAPEVVRAPRRGLSGRGFLAWADALAAGTRPHPLQVAPDDLCLIAYTSGSTGQPRGCMHSHRTVMSSIAGYAHWTPIGPHSAVLSTLPLFHVTGMQGSMNACIYTGARMVILTRWDAAAALALTESERITHWRLITTMLIDVLARPDLERSALASLAWVGGGGAAMPEAVAARLERLTGLSYIEGYGLSETVAASHVNPPGRPKRQCLGIPFVGVDSRILDPETLAEQPPGEVGEIVIAGPQVFLGYWRNPEASSAVFIGIDGKRFLRTGDLGFVDEEGYFFLVDRLKRMINAAGFKVWPAEIEALLHGHPGIKAACVVAAGDARRGETVKAFVVAREEARASLSGDEIRAWCASRMARYKVPAAIAFLDALPLLASGKVDWRALQAGERSRAGEPAE